MVAKLEMTLDSIAAIVSIPRQGFSTYVVYVMFLPQNWSKVQTRLSWNRRPPEIRDLSQPFHDTKIRPLDHSTTLTFISWLGLSYINITILCFVLRKIFQKLTTPKLTPKKILENTENKC